MDKGPVKTQRILWVEDDYYHIQSLLWGIEQASEFELEVAISLFEATSMLCDRSFDYYDLIVLDLVMSREDNQGHIPSWYSSEYKSGANGVGLLHYLREDLHITCPVLILSIMDNPIEHFYLESLSPLSYLAKSGLRPSSLKSEIERTLGN